MARLSERGPNGEPAAFLYICQLAKLRAPTGIRLGRVGHFNGESITRVVFEC